MSRVRGSDLLVLILAHRYGSMPPGSAHSITELEYCAARASNVPVLAFIVDGKTPWLPIISTGMTKSDWTYSRRTLDAR